MVSAPRYRRLVLPCVASVCTRNRWWKDQPTCLLFNVARDDGVRRDLLLQDLTRLYGSPSKGGDCCVWSRAGGAIQFCPLGAGAVAHWNDVNWQRISSVIPGVAPTVP